MDYIGLNNPRISQWNTIFFCHDSQGTYVCMCLSLRIQLDSAVQNKHKKYPDIQYRWQCIDVIHELAVNKNQNVPSHSHKIQCKLLYFKYQRFNHPKCHTRQLLVSFRAALAVLTQLCGLGCNPIHSPCVEELTIGAAYEEQKK